MPRIVRQELADTSQIIFYFLFLFSLYVLPLFGGHYKAAALNGSSQLARSIYAALSSLFFFWYDDCAQASQLSFPPSTSSPSFPVPSPKQGEAGRQASWQTGWQPVKESLRWKFDVVGSSPTYNLELQNTDFKASLAGLRFTYQMTLLLLKTNPWR